MIHELKWGELKNSRTNEKQGGEAMTKNAGMLQGGNSIKGRRESDFYATPPEVTQALINFLKIPKSKVIWECASGQGDMVNVFRNSGDFIITNPPFSLAEEFIRRAIELNMPFAFLLKSNYWQAAQRRMEKCLN